MFKIFTDWIFKFLLGDDIFISYSRADGASYAAGLANELADLGYSCKLDLWGTEATAEMPESLKKALRRSACLVLIGTKGAAESDHVHDEILMFKKTKRMIVPVIFEGVLLAENRTCRNGKLVNISQSDDDSIKSLSKAKWAKEIQGLPISFEVSEALRTGVPTNKLEKEEKNEKEAGAEKIVKQGIIQYLIDNLQNLFVRQTEVSNAQINSQKETNKANFVSTDIVNRAKNTFNFSRKDERQKITTTAGSILLLFLLTASAIAGVLVVYETGQVTAAFKLATEKEQIANQKTKDAEIAANKADIESNRAVKNEEIANQKTEEANIATKRADEETNKANKATKLADEKNKLAQEKTKLADEKTKIAVQQTKIADAETNRANKERSIADAIRLSNESVDLLSQNDPALFKESYNQAITANELVETNGLFLTEPISSLRKVLAFTPKVIQETSLPRIKLETKCDDENLSINKLSFACRKGNQIEVYQVLNPEKPPKIFDFKENLAKQEVQVNGEDYENSCLYNTRENTVPTPSHFRVSDDGNSVALSITDEYFGKDGRRDGELDGHRILVRTLKKASVCQETNDIRFIKLSPDGKSLVYSDRNYGGYNDSDINRLKLWRIRKESTILDCGSSLNLELIGNYSPDGKRFVTATSVGSDNSITIINQFLIDSPKESANCTQTPLVDGELNTQSEYFLASDYITIELGKVTDIAINNTGNKIALESNGISIWKLTPYPKLEVLIPPQSSAYSSFLFVEEPSSKQENLMTLTINKMQVNSQTWSIKSYEGGEECEICDQNRDPSKLSGFSAEHPEFNFEINESKTRLIIKRKSDSAVIDKIEFGEVIEEFAFSADGSEIITKSYKESALTTIGDRLNGRKDYNYRRWKIGYRNLSRIINERLPQFSLKK